MIVPIYAKVSIHVFKHQYYSNLEVKLSMNEDMFLVASLKLLIGKYNFDKPNDLKHHILIYVIMCLRLTVP